MEYSGKILRFVPTLYNPYDTSKKNLGGVQIQVYRLIKELSQYELKQDVLTQNKSKFKSKNINIISPLFSNLVSLLFFGIIFTAKNHKQYDCVHIHADGGLISLLFGEYVHYFTNLPIIYTFHCCRNVNYNETFLEKIFRPLMNLLEIKCINHAAHNVFLSKSVIEALKSNKIICEKVKCSYISDAININNSNCENLNKNSNNLKVVLFIGRINHQKGWDIVVECAKKLKDEPYFFQIYGTGSQEKKLVKLIKKYHLDNIKYYGAISNEYVKSIISIADTVIIPSYFEEFGSVVLEAGLMRKNVIASNTGGLSEILSHNRGYLVEVGCVNKFCKGIKYILDSNELDYGVNLYRYIVKNHSLNVITKKYYNIYKKYFINIHQ